MGQRQDCGRSSRHQEHGHREGTFASSSEDPLLSAGGRRDPRRDWRLEEEAGSADPSRRRSEVSEDGGDAGWSVTGCSLACKEAAKRSLQEAQPQSGARMQPTARAVSMQASRNKAPNGAKEINDDRDPRTN